MTNNGKPTGVNTETESISKFWNMYQKEFFKKNGNLKYVVKNKQDQNYNTLLVEQLLPGDFEIRVNDRSWKVHEAFFRKKSEYFKRRKSFNLSKGVDENGEENCFRSCLVLDNVPKEFEDAMESIVRFVYDTNFMIDIKAVIPALILVDFLQIQDMENGVINCFLKNNYAYFLLSVCVSIEENSCALLNGESFAILYGKRNVFEKFIAENFSVCCSNDSHMCLHSIAVFYDCILSSEFFFEKKHESSLQPKLSPWVIAYSSELARRTESGDTTYGEGVLKFISIAVENVAAFYVHAVDVGVEETKRKCLDMIVDQIDQFYHEDLLLLKPKDLLVILKRLDGMIEANSLFELVHEKFSSESISKESLLEWPGKNDVKEKEEMGLESPNCESIENEIWKMVPFNKLTKENLNKFVLRSDVSIDLIRHAILLYEHATRPTCLSNLSKTASDIVVLKVNGSQSSSSCSNVQKMLRFKEKGSDYISGVSSVHFELGGNSDFVPRGYLLGAPGTKYRLKSWQLLGITKGKKVVLLSSIENDKKLKAKEIMTFKCKEQTEKFVSFQLKQTGKNHGGDNDFGVSGIDILSDLNFQITRRFPKEK